MDKYKLIDDKPVQEQLPSRKEDGKQAPPSSSNSSASKPETKDHAYKNKNKARFANHNRKAQKSKKLAKAGPPPS